MTVHANEVKRIFMRAIAETSTVRREAYLDRACGKDTELRHAVDDFLKSHAELGAFLDTPAMEIGSKASEVEAGSAEEAIGATVGDYLLLELIGEGGFGNVYRAEQASPRREVALKIIKLGMDTRQVIARFEVERQALALMDHPGIARVFAAGSTALGRPYFVMELVHGVPVTEYCDQHQLTTKRRLRLFIDICHAVQHAHQKGVIHRDIKPSNVLVSKQDGKPVVKIIDFGVAKAMKQRLTEKTLFTEHRQLIGTPEYMSPEQASFNDENTDTRSDVYSLGVLLYELLVGVPPFDSQSLRSRGYDEVCRIIRECEPPTPSQRMSTLGDSVDGISQQRLAEPESLQRLLQRDLDWIAMKALEKDRTRRYESVDSLAADIVRHLDDEPVLARPPSRGYRLKKMIRKHRFGVAAGLGVFAALLAGLALMAFGLIQARHEREIATRERDRAEENLLLARQLMSEVIRPAAVRMFDLPYAQEEQREVLEKAILFYQQIVAQANAKPEVRRELAEMHFLLGWSAYDNGQNPEPHLHRSIAILQNLTHENPTDPNLRFDLSRSRGQLSEWLASELRTEAAIQVRRASLNIVEQLATEYPSKVEYQYGLEHGHSQLGRRLAEIGMYEEGEDQLRIAIRRAEEIAAPFRVATGEYLGRMLMRCGRYDDAKQVLEESRIAAEHAASLRPSPLSAAWASKLVELARIRRVLGLWCLYTAEYEKALEHLEHAIQMVEQWSDDFPSSTWLRFLIGWWYHDLAEVQAALGRLEEAEAARLQALEAWNSVESPAAAAFPFGKAIASYRLGELLHQHNRDEEARQQFQQAIQALDDIGTSRSDNSFWRWPLVCMLADCPDISLRNPQRAMDLVQGGFPKESGPYWRYLALAQYRAGEWKMAADSIKHAMDLRQGGDAFDWLLLAMVHWQLGEQARAIEIHARAQDAFDTKQPVFYEHIGVMGVARLRAEAEKLLGNNVQDARYETNNQR